MRIPSGVTDQFIYFVAVDATDLKTRETGLSSFTVRRSRNGAASAAFTTPTVNETDVTNMPGVYELLLDEDMTIDSGDDSQAVCLHVTHAGMAPVTLQYELYRPKITAGETVTAASGRANADVIAISTDTTAADNLELAYDGTGYKDVDNVYTLNAGTAQGGAESTIQLAISASTSADYYNNTVIMLTGGTGAGQSRIISDYATDRTATVNGNWVTNPSTDTVYQVLPFGAVPGATAPTAAETAIAVWNALRASHTSGGSFGEYVNADVVAVSGDAAVANTLEAIFDGTQTVIQQFGVVDTGTAQSVSSTTIQLRSGFTAPDSTLAGMTAWVYSSTNGLHGTRQITAYNNSTKTATVDAWTQTPSGTVLYVIFAVPPGSTSSPSPVNVLQWNSAAVATPNVAGVPKTDITHVSGSGTAGTNLGAMFNGSGYAGGTTPLNVNVLQISGDVAAADALESILDGGGGTITAEITGNVTGNLSGSVGSVTGAVGSVTGAVGSVTGAVGSVTGNVGGNVVGSVATATALGAQAKADVNAEVVDALAVDTYAELAAVPAANAALSAKLNFLFAKARNKATLNRSTGAYALRNDADGASIATRTDADDGTVYTKAEDA